MPNNETQKPKISKNKYELSLAEFPVFMLSKTGLKQKDPHIYEDEIVGENGALVKRTWKVWPDVRFGHGSPSTFSTFYDLFQIWNEKGFDSQYIYFESLYNLSKRRGVARGKNFYNQLRRDLSCLVGIKIEAENAFWDNESRCYVDKIFHLFDEVDIYKDSKTGQMALPFSRIKASDVLYGSILANSILTLGFNGEFFHSLTPVEQRLAVYLSKIFRSQNIHKRDILKFASQLPLQVKEKKLIKQRLSKACEGLIKKGFDLLDSFEFQKGDKGAQLIVFRRRGNLIFPYIKDGSKQSDLTKKDRDEIDYLVDEILEVCQDQKSINFYKKAARLMPRQDIFRALSEVKEIRDTGEVKKSKGAIFTSLIRKYAREQEITL
jgi:hypothetical protein